MTLNAYLLWIYVTSGLVLSVLCVGPRCYSCDGVSHPKDCAKVVTCSANERCYSQRMFAPNLQEYYKLGCTSKNICDQTTFSLFNNQLVGRKRKESSVRASSRRQTQNEKVLCMDCCVGELCNKALCEATAVQRNRRCFDCSDVMSPFDCDRVVECPTDYSCFVQELRQRYSLRCISELQCRAIAQVGQFSHECVSCCKDKDYCNFNACNKTTGHTTPTTILIPTHPTTSRPKPVITITPSASISKMYSQVVTAKCTSNQIGAIKWAFGNNSSLPSGVTADVAGNLNIQQLNETNAGMYTCVTISTTGYVVSSQLIVHIKDTPPIVISITRNPSGQLTVGQSFSLHCVLIGYPLPHVTWSFIDTTGTQAIPRSVNYSSDDRTLYVGQYNSAFDDGVWTCMARNKIGKSDAYVTIP